ncbi:MAG: GT4 family glycosyltransferase PelF [Candidatus Gygaella obscura]|nr:GT4 family glycosyltransferase PelF [Candidatus Gygaella obscura]
MNILQILPQLNVGGVETGVVDLSRRLVEDGHKVVVVSSGGMLVSDLEKSGVKHYTLAVHRKNPFVLIKTIPQLAKIIKDEHIEVIHGRSRVPAWVGFIVSFKTGVNFVTTCHGYYSRHFFSRVMALGKYVICPSNIIARHMVDDFSVKRDNIVIIPRGVDISKYSFIRPDERNKQDFTIGIIGRLTPLKGHVHFLNAAAKLHRIIPNLRIWIVGDAAKNKQDYKEELKTLCRKLGIAERVDFLGYQKDIASILSKMNILVLSTVTEEAFGRVIIESQAAGVPVVATRVGGVIDIIKDNETGILVNPADSEAIKNAVIRFYNDDSFTNSLALKARAYVEERFTLENMYQKTLSVYKKTIVKKRIIVIKLTALGDVILAVPSLRAIKKKFKNHTITCLVNKNFSSLLWDCPYVDDLIVDDKDIQHKGFFGLLRLAKKIIYYRFDISIDLQNNKRSHLLSFLGIIAERYGFFIKRKLSFLINRTVSLPQQVEHPVRHQLNVLRLLDIKDMDDSLELWVNKDAKKLMNSFLEKHWLTEDQKLIGINIGASSRWKSKCWPSANIVKLCDMLKTKNMRVVFTGTKADLAIAQEVTARLKDFKPIIACGQTNLAQLIALVDRCSVLISGDSAPIHIASSLNVPFVALFGPTDPSKHLHPKGKYRLLRKEVPCSPCYRSKCKKNICMKLITSKEVFEKVEELLV